MSRKTARSVSPWSGITYFLVQTDSYGPFIREGLLNYAEAYGILDGVEYWAFVRELDEYMPALYGCHRLMPWSTWIDHVILLLDSLVDGYKEPYLINPDDQTVDLGDDVTPIDAWEIAHLLGLPKLGLIQSTSSSAFSIIRHPKTNFVMNSPFIGYYNPHDYPVSFSSGMAQAAPIEIQPGQPVVDANGHLIPTSPILEQQCRPPTPLLRRIPRDDPKFKNWDNINDQRHNALLTKEARPHAPRRDNRQDPRSAHPPEVNISSTRGVEPVDTSTKYGTLPPGTQVGDDGLLRYDGRTFSGGAAIQAYIDSKGGRPEANMPAPSIPPQPSEARSNIVPTNQIPSGAPIPAQPSSPRTVADLQRSAAPLTEEELEKADKLVTG